MLIVVFRAQFCSPAIIIKPFLILGKKRQMASSKVLSRLSSRLGSLTLKPSKCSIASEIAQLKPTTSSGVAVSTRRISRSSRLPLQLSCADSLMPLYSAMASARLVSSLSIESGSWALVPQGISMPL